MIRLRMSPIGVVYDFFFVCFHGIVAAVFLFFPAFHRLSVR